jgi:hypothetical protein
MSPRLQVASLIYAQLVLQDMRASIDNPTRNAHRALLFADALLLCDKQSAPFELDAQARPDLGKPEGRPPVPPLPERVIKRRDTRSLH